jgi:hypothetical protein
LLVGQVRQRIGHDLAGIGGVRGREEIDLTVDPPPDLAIKIELSPATRDPGVRLTDSA